VSVYVLIYRASKKCGIENLHLLNNHIVYEDGGEKCSIPPIFLISGLKLFALNKFISLFNGPQKNAE